MEQTRDKLAINRRPIINPMLFRGSSKFNDTFFNNVVTISPRSWNFNFATTMQKRAVLRIFSTYSSRQYWIPFRSKENCSDGVSRVEDRDYATRWSAVSMPPRFGRPSSTVLDSTTPEISDIGCCVLIRRGALRIGKRYWIRWFEGVVRR